MQHINNCNDKVAFKISCRCLERSTEWYRYTYFSSQWCWPKRTEGNQQNREQSCWTLITSIVWVDQQTTRSSFWTRWKNVWIIHGLCRYMKEMIHRFHRWLYAFENENYWPGRMTTLLLLFRYCSTHFINRPTSIKWLEVWAALLQFKSLLRQSTPGNGQMKLKYSLGIVSEPAKCTLHTL